MSGWKELRCSGDTAGMRAQGGCACDILGRTWGLGHQLIIKHRSGAVMLPLVYPILALLFSLFFLLKWASTSKTKGNLPPSPPKLPILGNLHQVGPLPHRSLQALAEKHGQLMLLHFGSVPVLVASSAEAAQEIMKTHDQLFASRPKSSVATKLLHDKDVVFSPYGQYWRQMKSICVIHLLSNKMVGSFRRVRKEETALMVEKIKQSCSSPVNLSHLFALLSNAVVTRAALGRKNRGGKFKELAAEAGRLLGVFNVEDYIPWLAWLNRFNGLNAAVDKAARDVNRFLEEVVEEHVDRQNREGNGSQHDFVDLLLQMQRDSTPQSPLLRDSIKAIIWDMFSAGVDTTFTALDWILTELLRHPRVMKELQNEVRGVGGGKLEISEDDLDKMHYMRAVIKECLRLHPPVPLLVPREVTHDVKVMGYDVAAGTQVIVNSWAIQRDPSLWEKPEEFRPERFLEASIDFVRHDFKLIPFGSGRRSCPGVSFSMALVELALANLVCNFDFALPDGARGEDFDMTEVPGLSVHRKEPLLAIPTLCTM